MKINMPHPVQDFEGSQVDLSEDPAMFGRFLELVDTFENPENNMTALESVRDLQNSTLFKDLNDEEKSITIESQIEFYEKLAREKLREEYPVIDQMILNNETNQ